MTKSQFVFVLRKKTLVLTEARINAKRSTNSTTATFAMLK